MTSSPPNPPDEVLLPTATMAETWRAVRALTRPHRWLALAAVLVLLTGTGAGLVVPPILGWMVNLILDRHGPGAITVPVLLLLAAAIGQAVLTGLGDILVARLGESVLAGLRERVVTRALRLPLQQLETAGSGDLFSRVSGDVSVIASAVRSALPALAGAGLTVGLTIVGLAALDWRFALAGLLASPIQLYTLRWYLTRSTPLFAAERVAEGSRTQQLLDSIGGADTVRTYRLTTRHVAKVRDHSRAALDYALATNQLATRFFGRLNLAEFVGLAAILAVGFWLTRAGAVTVGATAAAALYFHRLFDPINTLLGLFGTAQEAAAGLARLVGISTFPTPPPHAGSPPAGSPQVGSPQPVAEPAGAAVPADPLPAHPRGAAVRVEHVSFGYHPAHLVLHDISIDITAGEHVALIGASGAGKSTLGKLLAGIHHPTTGHITLDGTPLRVIPDGQLRRTVALITQEVHVFAGSIADDLHLAAPDATDTQLHTALETVHATAWVDALPDGLDTIVGQGGHPLSATQAQQLALARLVLADPTIAVLDEATADAGSAGARLLDQAAAHALQHRSALIVTHRLSQAATAHRIIVLDAGRILETGNHQQLLKQHGAYADLWNSWSQTRHTHSAPTTAGR